MRPKRLLASRVALRCAKRIALILLALLTLVSVPVLARGVAETTQHSSPISQASKPSQLAIQGKQLYDAGEFDAAARVWQQAASAYAKVGDSDGKTQSLINVAEALLALGLYPRACNTLLQAFEIAAPNCQNLTQQNERQQRDSLIKTLEERPNSRTKAIGLRSLGDVSPIGWMT